MGRLVAVTSCCVKRSLNLLARINYWKDNGMLINYHNCRWGRLVVWTCCNISLCIHLLFLLNTFKLNLSLIFPNRDNNCNWMLMKEKLCISGAFHCALSCETKRCVKTVKSNIVLPLALFTFWFNLNGYYKRKLLHVNFNRHIVLVED